MEEAGQHQEGPGEAGAQRPPPDLLRRADPPRGDQEEGAAPEGEEAAQTGQDNTVSFLHAEELDFASSFSADKLNQTFGDLCRFASRQPNLL